MKKKSHTPGPWGYEDPMGPDILHVVANPGAQAYDWITVALVSTENIDEDKRSFKEHAANARLIAAAPELLDMLKHAVHWHDQLTPEDVSRYQAIIDKAEGN